jgi:beta-glucanase (GH16 family)
LAALGVATAGLAAAIWLPGIGDASASEQRPAFADDFSGSQGTTVDMTKWNIDGGAQNGVEDGAGRLVVTRLLRTRQAFTQPYGHAEASIEVERASGAWRAFGVLDQFGRPISGRLQTLQGGIDPTGGDAFHAYAIDWSPQAIVWTVDGRPTLRLLPFAPAQGIVLVLNFAADGTKSARMIVDFVHVTVWGRAGTFPPGGGGGSQPGSWPSGWPSGWPTEWPGQSPSASASATPTDDPTTDPPTTTPPTTAAPSPSESSASPSPSATSASPSPTAKATAWAPFTDYAVGDLVTYEGVTYRVLEAHTSLPGWEPPALPNLFAKV